jgi:N-acetylmuramoyl-L-alanine amidase
MINNEYLKESQDLSIVLEDSFNKNIPNLSVLHTGVGQANFYVLNGALMPSVLIETCFISNPKEEKMLINKKFQSKVAKAIGQAILDFRVQQLGLE